MAVASKRKGQKKLKDLNAPKRPMSGYFIFGQEVRGKEGGLGKLPVAEQGRMISEMWKGLGEGEREKYNERSAKDRMSYQSAVEKYKKTDEFRDFQERAAAADPKEKKKTKKATGYNEFFKTVYKAVAQEHSELKMGEATSLVAKRWKELSKDEKAVYNRMAEERNEELGLAEK